MKTAWYWLIRNLVRYCFFWITGGFRVYGAKNVPKSGAIILAPNHSSFLDPPAVACALPRMTTFMAKEELFRNRIFGGIIRSLGAFPVRRGTTDTEAIRLSASLLQAGSALLIFPEGGRSDGTTLKVLNRGAELLARKSDAVVVPVGISGNQIKWGKGKKKWFHRVTVRFGEPISPNDFTGSKTAFAEELARRIVLLCQADGYDLKNEFDTMQSRTSSPDDGANEALSPS